MTGKVMVNGREFEYELSDEAAALEMPYKDGHKEYMMVHILQLKEKGKRIAVLQGVPFSKKAYYCYKFPLELRAATDFMNGNQKQYIEMIIECGYYYARIKGE